FRVLKDAIAFSLSEDNRRTPELVHGYLKQIKAIPGTSVSEQLELAELERDAQYVEARQRLTEGTASLKEAAQLFRQSARGQGGRNRDGEYRAQAIDAAVERLSKLEPSAPGPQAFDETRDVAAGRDARTATVGTSSGAKARTQAH